jgi:hypothetical protein
LSDDLRSIVLALEKAKAGNPPTAVLTAMFYAQRVGWIDRPTLSTAMRMVVNGACVDAALLLMRPEWYYMSGKGRTRPDEPIWGCIIELPGQGPAALDQEIGRAQHHHSHACAIVLAVIEANGEGQ